MKILALDTTSNYPSLAVLDDLEIKLEYNFVSIDNLSVTLMPNLEFVLAGANLALNEVELFAVGIGPGNFTGIRIGLATLKGILFPAPKPVVAVNTLKALASKAAPSNKTIVPLVDARRGEVYYAAYRLGAEETATIEPPGISAVEKLHLVLPADDDFLFIGSGLDRYREYLREAFPSAKMRFRSNFLASEMGRLAWLRYQKNDFLTDLGKLLPFYIRPPDAEKNLSG